MNQPDDSIQEKLQRVLAELREQDVQLPTEILSYQEQLQQLDEWINDVNEWEIAFESIVALLEMKPALRLSGPSAVALTEVALLFGYKTERVEDRRYDRRRSGST